MTTFDLHVELDNAAFEDEPGELARILRRLAARFEDTTPQVLDGGEVMDTNGNRVGWWGIDIEDADDDEEE